MWKLSNDDDGDIIIDREGYYIPFIDIVVFFERKIKIHLKLHVKKIEKMVVIDTLDYKTACLT